MKKFLFQNLKEQTIFAKPKSMRYTIKNLNNKYNFKKFDQFEKKYATAMILMKNILTRKLNFPYCKWWNCCQYLQFYRTIKKYIVYDIFGKIGDWIFMYI